MPEKKKQSNNQPNSGRKPSRDGRGQERGRSRERGQRSRSRSVERPKVVVVEDRSHRRRSHSAASDASARPHTPKGERMGVYKLGKQQPFNRTQVLHANPSTQSLYRTIETGADRFTLGVLSNCLMESLHYGLPSISTPGGSDTRGYLPGLPGRKDDGDGGNVFTALHTSKYGLGYNFATSPPSLLPVYVAAPTVIAEDLFYPLPYSYTKGTVISSVSIDLPADDTQQYTIFFDPCNITYPIVCFTVGATGQIEWVEGMQCQWNTATPYEKPYNLVQIGGEMADVCVVKDAPASGVGEYPSPPADQFFVDAANTYFVGGASMSVTHTNPTAFTKTAWRARSDYNVTRRAFDIVGDPATQDGMPFLEGYRNGTGATATYRGSKWVSAYSWLLLGEPASPGWPGNAMSAYMHAFEAGFPLIQFRTTNVSQAATTNFQFTIRADVWLGVSPYTIKLAAACPFVTEPYVMPSWSTQVRAMSHVHNPEGPEQPAVARTVTALSRVQRALPSTTPFERRVATAPSSASTVSSVVSHPAVVATGSNASTIGKLLTAAAGVGAGFLEDNIPGAVAAGASGLETLFNWIKDAF